MTIKYVCSGGLRADYLITHLGEAMNGMVGGNALYAAVGAALWQDGVGLWARSGENYPEAWLAALVQTPIDSAGIISIPGYQEHRTFFAYLPDGRRDDTNPAAHYGRIHQPMPAELAGYLHSTLGQDEPDVYEPLALRPEDWPPAFDSAMALHLSPLSLCTHRHVPAALRPKGVTTITLDPGERYMVPERADYVRHLLPQIDAFLPSDKEIWSLFGNGADLWKTAVTLHQWGAALVVIKMGANGVLVYDGRHHTHLPAYHAARDPRVVDVTGAGDSFCGGFLVGLVETADPIEAARRGMVSASLVIEGYGALYALSRRPDASRRLAAIKKSDTPE